MDGTGRDPAGAKYSHRPRWSSAPIHSRKRAAEVNPLELREERIVIQNKIIGNLFRNVIEAPQGNFVGGAESSGKSLERLLDSVRRAPLQVVVNEDGG